MNNGSAQETSDVEKHKQAHTSRNFDATKQIPANTCPVNNGTNKDRTSDINGHKVVNTTGDINATKLPSTNNTPVYDDNGGNASGRDDQNYGGALEAWDINEGRPIESTGNNSVTKQPSANDSPVNNATDANWDDGCNGDVPVVPPDNNATATNASGRDHLNDGGVHETSDVDGTKPVHTSRNFDATKQLPADNLSIDNGTAANESPKNDQQESSFGTTSIGPSSANNPPQNNANVANAYMRDDQVNQW